MKIKILMLLGLLSLVYACRKETGVALPTNKQIPLSESQFKGLYLLNEGNMGTNKASLDYVNFKTGVFSRNIFPIANPTEVLGLGDVGNDVLVYGNKVYIVVNNSQKIEVLDLHSNKKIKTIAIKTPRYLTSYQDKVYCTSYKLESISDITQDRNGFVAVIDTLNLTIEKQIVVGRQPEGLVEVQGKLYVANSGGYDLGSLGYDQTVSVIDLKTQKEIQKIKVAINLNQIGADQKGNVYVQSRGDYQQIPANLYMIDSKNNQVVRDFKLEVTRFYISENNMYYYSSNFNKTTQSYSKPEYKTMDLTTFKINEKAFISDSLAKSIDLPYGLIVDPSSHYIFLTDAKDYVSPGVLHCIDASGKTIWSQVTGDIPGHFALVNQ